MMRRVAWRAWVGAGAARPPEPQSHRGLDWQPLATTGLRACTKEAGLEGSGCSQWQPQFRLV
jgi:hypothetical protein